MAKANVTGGTIGGAVGKISTSNVTGGKIGGPVDVKKVKNAPVIFQDMPVSMQIHLTDKQKQEAAKNRGFNSASEEAAYAKNNPNLYKVTGGQKYMENGYAALKNPQSVITPNNLTDEGQKAVKAAQDADRRVNVENLPIRGQKVTNINNILDSQSDIFNVSQWFSDKAKSEENYNRTYAPRAVLKDIISKASKDDGRAAINSGDFSSRPDSQKVTDLKKSYWDTYTDEKDYAKTPILDKYVTPFRTEKAQRILSYLDTKGLKSELKEYQDFLKIEEDKARVQLDLEMRKQKYKTDKLSAVTDSVKSVPANMIGGVLAEGSNIVQGTANELGIGSGNINVYDGWHTLANYAINTREAVTENIDSKIGKFAYQTGMSMADSAVTALIAQGLGVLGVSSTVASALATIPMASAAANMTTREMLEEGYTPQQAFRMGVASGFAEFITEKYSVEKLLNIGSFVGIKEMILNISKQALAEGSEEVASNILNRIFEAGILGSESHNNKLFQYYIESGLTEKEAYVKVLQNNLYDDFMAFAGGVISGGIMGGGTTVVQTRITENKLGKSAVKNGMEGEILNIASSMPADTSAYKYAKNFGNEVTPRQVGRTALLIDEYIKELKNDKVYNTVYDKAIELGATKPQAKAIANYKAGVETQQFSDVNELLDAYKNATASKIGAVIIDELSSEEPSSWVKELNNSLSAVYSAEARLREALNDSPGATEQVQNPDNDTDSEADNGFDEVTATDNAGDDSDIEVSEDRQAEKNTAAAGGENINPEADEQNIFTEPDKREINENMINGRGLNIVQEHIEETAKKLDPGIVIKWDPNLDKGGSFNPYSKVLTLRADLTTAEAYIEIFKHEFMHDLELRGGYDKFLKFLENKSEAFAQYAKNVLKEYDRKYTGGNAGAVKALFDLYYEIYTTDERIMPVARKAFTLENAKREAAADFFADVLFKGKEYRSEIATALKYDNELPEGSYETSLSALEEIAHKDKNLFHRIIEAVKRFISNIKGNKTTRKLEADLARLERKLQDVYESAETKKPTEDGGVKYSLSFNGQINSTESKQIISILRNNFDKISNDILFDEKSVDIRHYKHKSDYVLEIFNEQGNVAVNKTLGEVELVRSGAKSTMLHGFGKNKIAAVPAIKLVIENGDIISHTPNYTNNYDRYIIAGMGKLDGRVAVMGVVINAYNGNSTNKFYLHETEIIEADLSSMTGSPNSEDTVNKSASNSIISTPDTKSQEKVSDSNREYLELAKEPEKNAAKLHELVENAAKEAGYSERLYHQTENNFTIFDTRHAGAGSRDNETPFGIFMKKTDADIGLKGKKQIGLFAKIEKPLKAYSRDSLVNSLERLSPEYKVIKEQLANLDKEYQEKVDNAHKEWQEWVAEWRNKNPNAKRVDAYNDPEFESVFSKEGEMVDEWSEKAATLDKKAKEIITSTLKSNDYDGIILLNDQGSFGRRTDAYIALEPSQVKSADLVTYDDNGNVIPLSERFNTENEDIRYSLKGDRLEELRYNPTMFAKRLINKFDIKNVEVEELAGKLRELVVKHNKGGKDWDYNSEGEYTITSTIDSLVDELSKDLAGYIKLNLTDTAQEVLKTIRRDRVYVDHIQRQEINDKYGSVTKFNKATGMRVSDSANASLDSQWQEWAELYPQYFDPDMNAANMPEECERIINSMKNWREEIDDDSAAESIAREIKYVLDNTGTRARKREKSRAVNEAVKKARADEQEKANKKFDEYRQKESARRDKEAASKRKREYRDKALKLRNKFTKMLENPKKGSYVPQPFVKAVVDALDIIYDNPIDYDDTKIGGKYYSQLEKLNQEIQNASNDTVREALKEKYDRLFKTATNAGDRVLKIKEMLDALKDDEKSAKEYERLYTDDDKGILFPARTKVYSEVMSEMLGTLARELGDTAAYNYNEHQLRIISEVFTALDNHISNYNKLIGREERIEVSEAAEQLIGELLRSHGDFSKVNKAILAQASPRTILNMLGNYETNSQWMKLYEELNSGENKAIAYHMKAENMIIEEILGDKELFLETQKMFSTDKKDLVDSGLIDKDGNKVMVTRGMRLCLIKHGLNEQNRKALIGGVEVPKNLKDYYEKGAAASKEKENVLQAKIPDAGEEGALRWFTKLNSSLTEIEKKWLKVLEKYYSEISAPALNEVTMQIYGFKKATVKNYWRMLRTDHFIDKPLDTVLKDSMLEHAGYLEKRKNSSQPLYLIDAIDQLNMDIDNHANYYGLVIPLSNFSKVYNYAQFDFESGRWGDSVKSTINDKYSNGSVKKYLENLIADLNGARHSEVNFLDRMRGRYAQAVLALNPRVAVKQTASYPTAAAVIGWKPLIKALAVIENKDGEKKFVFARAELKEIAKYSPLLWYRMRGNMDVELGSLKEAGSPGDKLAKKMPALLGWINKMDAATVGRLWYASKYYVEDNFKYEKGSPEYYKKTAEIFEKVIEETQPNYSVMQRPDILRSKNALTRALTMFYTQRLQNANILFDSAMEWKTKHKAYKNATENGKAIARDELKEARARFGRAVSSQVVSNVILNVMEFAIRAALSQMNPYRDKNDEVTASEILKGLGLNIVGTMFGTVLFGSELFDVIKFAAGLAEGKYYGMQVPVIETINDITNAVISDGKWIIDVVKDIKDGKMTANDFAEQITARTLDDLTKVAQPLTGIPIKNAKDMISGIVHSVMDAINGEVFSYEAAVDNNAYNRIVGARPRTNTQYYRILAEAVINDDKEKYESTLKRLLDRTNPDKDTLSGIKKALKASEAVKTEADKAISGVKSKKVYKSLSDAGKDSIDSDIRDAIAKEKILRLKSNKSKEFKKLFEYSKYKDKTDFDKLKREFIKDGFSEDEISIGLEVEKFRLLKEQGITVAEWFTAKKKLSEENARKNAEKYEAIQKMDFSAEDKETLWENLK